jgi:hypothetical protein
MPNIPRQPAPARPIDTGVLREWVRRRSRRAELSIGGVSYNVSVDGEESGGEVGPVDVDIFGDAMPAPATISRNAVTSPDGRYRYRLARQWTPGGVLIAQPLTASPAMLVIMLNPSIADGLRDDPTIRRCMGFAKREGCKRLEVVNLFAMVATMPEELGRVAAANPGLATGEDNADAILDAVECSDLIVAAWGDFVARHDAAMERAGEVIEMLVKTGREVKCLGVTKRGHPRHPLYVKADAPLIPFQTAFDLAAE